jgi:hypothetical protein
VFVNLSNAYIDTAKAVRKRPCLVKVTTLEAGTTGLRAARGKLNTFYGNGSGNHAHPLFQAHITPHPTNPTIGIDQVNGVENFNGFLYVSVTFLDGVTRHYYLDGGPAITDVNCPHSKQIKKIGQKIYAAKGNNVAFCATGNPRDWSTPNDAGFLPTGIQTSGSDTVTAIGDYGGDLVVFYPDNLQVWKVDADPALNQLRRSAQNIGTSHAEAVQTLAGDLVFLSQQGFRSVSLVALTTDNLQEHDVGSAIDALRDEIAPEDDPRMVYYPRLGQLWCVVSR